MVSLHSNMGGMRAQDSLAQSHRMMATSLERLSSGVRINRAEDDAAGLLVRDRFQAQMNGFEEGIRNIQTAQGMIQVAEQGLNKLTEALQQMRALAVRAADDNLTDDDRKRVQEQVKGLLREINERAQRTNYNGHNLLDGSIRDARAERQGVSQIQTNSFLANGNTMVTGTEVIGGLATVAGGVSQGSYEVKLVFDASRRDNPVATTSTVLGGDAASGNGYLNSTTSPVVHSMEIFDREGNSHDVNIEMTFDSGNTWDYSITSGTGGAWANGIDVSGSVTFTANGEFQSLSLAGGTTTSTQSGSNHNITIADGSAGGQVWSLNFGKMRENDQSPAVNTPNIVATSGSAGSTTTSGTITGNLDSTVAAGTTASNTTSWVDRAGASHTVTYDLQKVTEQTGGSDLADTWRLNIQGLSGGDWSGANANTNVDVVFDTSGNVVSIGGQAGSSFNVNIGDGTASGQDITLDLSGLTNTAVATALGAPETSNGSVGAPTTSVALTNATRLSAGYGPTTINFNNIIDRTGTQSVSGASITFTQVGTSNTWEYAVSGPETSSFTGDVRGGTGSISFTEDGDLIGPNTLNFVLEDGTAEGQQLSLNLTPGTPLKMGRAENVTSASNGSAGAGELTVNAEIFYSGAADTDQPVMTLSAVSQGAKTANLGGVSFTVNQATSLDVGLTTYLKAYTYQSATTVDNALEFQVGPDEGMTERVGIQKMDVQSIFRGGVAEYAYGDVKLDTQLEAQDLIGQIDDALNYVGSENLKVGQFQNKMTRTLDLQRQNNTSITNAYSLLNDADMAKEATAQSKRMILVQSGTAMVAQANTTSQFLLQLLR